MEIVGSHGASVWGNGPPPARLCRAPLSRATGEGLMEDGFCRAPGLNLSLNHKQTCPHPQPGTPMRLFFTCLLTCLLPTLATAQPFLPEQNTGHHFAHAAKTNPSSTLRDDARIGWDFGHDRNVNFASTSGHARLKTALLNAVNASETLMSFDLGFDFRSIVQERNGRLQLYPGVLASLDTFLVEIERANLRARDRNSRFGADLVLTDYRVADGINRPGENEEHTDYLTTRRAEFLQTLEPIFTKIATHTTLTLNLMNEPEFAALSVSKAAENIETGQWPNTTFSTTLLEKIAKKSAHTEMNPTQALQTLDQNEFVSVHHSRENGTITLHPATLSQQQMDTFLIALAETIHKTAPNIPITIGWGDDQSALGRTPLLISQGQLITDIISFHVYNTRTNPYHPLRSTRENFNRIGLGNRIIRITEWGLGGQDDHAGNIPGAILNALRQTQQAGYDGIVFWWDDQHDYAYNAYREAWETHTGKSAPGPPVTSLSRSDFNTDGRVNFADFLLFAAGFGVQTGEPGFDTRLDLDGNGIIGFLDFLRFASDVQKAA
ncbi:MAG: hypothetical protein O2954_15775 [bacterium]|nr:hypothetical protein [bacterium]